MVRFRIVTLVIFFALLLLAVASTLIYLELSKTVGRDFVFDISQGSNLITISDRLSEQDSLPSHEALPC